MMKKKLKDQKENKEINIDKSTDNKESSNTPENNTVNSPEEPGAVDANSISADTENGGVISTDKFIAEVRAVEEKLAEMQDKYIRLSAEFDNYRKRTLREKMELSKYAAEDLLKKIIPLMDDFDRALSHMDKATDCVAMKDGIDLIYNKFSDFLQQNGISEIESLNSNFNVDLHEAVAKVPVDEEDKKGKVVDILQKGYYIQDKVLRFSKVVVGE
jgi:molecular chaperone GrpE